MREREESFKVYIGNVMLCAIVLRFLECIGGKGDVLLRLSFPSPKHDLIEQP